MFLTSFPSCKKLVRSLLVLCILFPLAQNNLKGNNIKNSSLKNTLKINSEKVAVAAVDSAGDIKPTSQRVNNAPVGGGGAGRAPDTTISNKGTAQEDTAKSATKSKVARRTLGVNRHPMAVPEKFPKDGVYIWCDPDGVWTMFWKSRRQLDVKATITAAKPVIVQNAVRAKTKSIENQPNNLEISSNTNSRIGIAQFASVDDSVQFDILVNGKADPNSVYIGSLLNNPTQFPLKLNTRRLSHKASLGTKIVKSGKSQGADGLKAAVTAAPHGSGGRGGNKAGKTKK